MHTPTRITKKYRIMVTITEAIEEVVINQEDCCPSISSISNAIVEDSLTKNASSVIRSMLLDEVTNDVTKYWQEACKIVAAENQHIPFHYVTSKWYGKKRRTPETEEEAKKYVAMFGSGGIAGVRFLNDYEEASTDHCYAVFIQSLAENCEQQVKRIAQRFNDGIKSGAINVDKVKRLPDAVKIYLTTNIES